MRFLDRTAVAAPACLGRYHHGRDRWSDLATTEADYQEVRDRLDELQRLRCAYCESDLSRESTRPHVEHFERRSRARQKTFDWGNLFRSCTHPEQCGKFKDERAGAFVVGDILKPDQDDPRRYLFFATDGKVHPRTGLSPAERHRADETIRVFALNCGRLRGCRRVKLKPIVAELLMATDAGFPDEDVVAYIRLVAADHENDAYSSAIRDALGLAP